MFLRVHDPVFFASHVAPAISNRLDLDFVDLILLGRDVGEYAGVARSASLNVCEQILLARAIGGQTGAAIALDVVRRCSALHVPKQDWKDSARMNASMSFGVFARGVAEETEESGVMVGSGGPPRDMMMARGGGGHPHPAPPACPAPASPSYGPASPPACAPVMYQSAGKVKQIAERRWKDVPQPSAFFKELAMHTASCISCGASAPFVSPFVSTASGCALVALSFISLPVSSSAVKLQRRTQNGISSLHLVASGVCLRYFKDTVAIEAPPSTRVVIVGQHILESVFDPAAGWKMATVGAQGCLVGRPYALRTIVTNVSDKDVTVNTLTQIPSSSMPLYGTLHTNVKKLKVPSFSVKVVDNWFFFPLPGSVSVYPAQVASTAGECIGCAVPMPNVHVTASISGSATSSWPVIVSHGSEEQLIAALTSDMSLLRMRVLHILGRMAQSSSLLLSVFKILRDNSVCIPVVWALGLAGSIREAAAEFIIDILPPNVLASLIGSSLPLPIASRAAPFTVVRPSMVNAAGIMTGVCDFEPVFNARTHALGNYSTIAIEAMRTQYRRILWKVAIDPAPVRSDCVQLACAAPVPVKLRLRAVVSVVCSRMPPQVLACSSGPLQRRVGPSQHSGTARFC